MRKPIGPPPRPGYLEIDTYIDIKGVAPDHINLPPRGSSHLKNGPFGIGMAESFIQNRAAIVNTINALEQDYQVRSSQLSQTIETDLAVVRSEGPNDPVTPSQSLIRELQALNTLNQRKSAEYHTKTTIANAFYGKDPFNWTIHEYMLKATKMEQWPGPNGIAMRALNQSLSAANDARLLSQTIDLLGQRNLNLIQTINTLQAAEQAQLAAEQEAQRVAAEQARIQAEVNALAQAQEQARLAAIAEAERLAAEQARSAAVAETERLAAEQARLAAVAEAERLAAEAAAQQIAAERAHLEALAELQRLEELRQAEENARKTTLAMAGSTAAAGPLFAGTAGTLVVSQATSLAIRSALQSALTATVSAAVGSAGAVASGFAALVYPSPLGNSDLYSLSVPLSDLSPATDQNLSANAPSGGQVKLTVGIGSKADGSTIEYFVVAMNGTTAPYDVPVQLATYDPTRKVYTTQSPGLPSIGMTWTPIVQPGDASTSLPSTEPGIVVYEGATVTALEGRIDAFPELDLDSLGGFITVFPADSGIPPIYTMFRDRRNEAGVAGGDGETILGVWLGDISQNEGAAIPKPIADQLRGKQFSNFREFRESFWKAVAGADDLSKQFKANNIHAMKNGRAPFVPEAGILGNRIKFELHHIQQISKGGDVYGIDNIRIVTPKRHAEIHKGGN
ncbi:S-type pyocin domain-containing protein [Pseudomonas sp. TNT3]|uniref:S-type pyocin domain-containing protein n=1 Tax=Pseudomonas sp. TNT3 TaxID=2654097 RepID=UPI001FF4FD91|nr:S-type pyocin domain-containing protein [Pseudomonas sp. TNT3]KAI2690756.1 S-type pyocin domain-containing protein [Pseudomonas sp. TNT3]